MKKLFDQKLRLVTIASIVLILVLAPFHAFLTVFGNSLVGHYTLLRLWEEILLLPAAIGAGYMFANNTKLRRLVRTSWLWQLTAVYAVYVLFASVVAYQAGSVSLKALAYGVLIDLRFLLFFFVVWVAAAHSVWLRLYWRRLVLVPAGGVLVAGLLQRFVLPHDFLKHFGYNDQTIAPFETIDHKVQYLRIQSTLRGANLLGAYLILVLSTMFTALYRYKLAAGLVVGVVVLFLSGSRAAWIGAAVSLMVLLLLHLPSRRSKLVLVACMLGIGLAGSVVVFIQRNNDFVQNSVFHSDEHSRSSESSNAAHLRASGIALRQFLHEPLGRGPGTAGPASIHNQQEPARIAENYFLQIAQETGWVGLILFLTIYVLTGRQLWLRRKDSLPRALFAALLGLSCVAMLMHIWTDDTIAFLFWGLTGIALAPILKQGKPDAKTQTTD